jgi:hypothetical protein
MATALSGIAQAQPPLNLSVVPSSGSGLSSTSPAGTFDFTSSSAGGSSNIEYMGVLFNYGVDWAGACNIGFWSASNTVDLANDQGTGSSSGTLSPTAPPLQNSQCKVDLAGSSKTTGTNSVTVKLKITFLAGLPGPQNVYLTTYDNAGLSAPFTQVGTWTTTAVAPDLPSLVSVTPALGVGLSQTFNFVASSVNGAVYITTMAALVHTQINTAGGCYVYFNQSAKYI